MKRMERTLRYSIKKLEEMGEKDLLILGRQELRLTNEALRQVEKL